MAPPDKSEITRSSAPGNSTRGHSRIPRVTCPGDVVTTTAFATPAKNGSYLPLDVLWETETGKTSSNPHYFSAKDARLSSPACRFGRPLPPLPFC